MTINYSGVVREVRLILSPPSSDAMGFDVEYDVVLFSSFEIEIDQGGRECRETAAGFHELSPFSRIC